MAWGHGKSCHFLSRVLKRFPFIWDLFGLAIIIFLKITVTGSDDVGYILELFFFFLPFKFRGNKIFVRHLALSSLRVLFESSTNTQQVNSTNYLVERPGLIYETTEDK